MRFPQEESSEALAVLGRLMACAHLLDMAMIDDDVDGIWRHAEAIGYLRPEDSPAYCGRIIDLIRIVCEPLRIDAEYDFGTSNVAPRARDAGLELAMNSSRELCSPPPETVFLHRKLGGLYLLAARLRARVDVRAILEPHLTREVKRATA